MKKLIILISLMALLVGCSNGNDMDTNSQSDSNNTSLPQSSEPLASELDKQTVIPVHNDRLEAVSECLPDEEINELSSKKCGYGQGKRLNNENAPYGAIDFTSEFSKYNAFAIGEHEKVVYLTFDQGYENGYTAKILDTLKANDVKATFFIVGDYLERNSDLVKRMIDEGHEVGNHSLHHYSMPDLDVTEVKSEILQLHNQVKEKFGYEMTCFRPPMGEFSEKSLAATQSCKYKTVLWSYAYADWDVNKQMEPSAALAKLKEAVHEGAIYLLHSVSSTNEAILDDFIKSLKNEGYVFKLI